MTDQIQEYDVLGVGFGPANLSIAIALEETAQKQNLSYCFLEQKSHFEWHGGMLLDGTRMQISCLKDLVTLRNPTSPYSFVNYLHAHDRLSSFINLGSLHPSRVEFNDYLTWVAKQFESVVTYAQRVVYIEPIEQDGEITKVRVISTDIHGNRTIRLAKNLLIGMGGMPKLPTLFSGLEDENVIHSSQYKVWRETFDKGATPPKIAVVGAGQSAAEIFVDLTNRYGDGEVHLVNRNFALHPADDSAFVNEIFDPEFTDHVYSRTEEERKKVLSRFNGTNYSVVDTEELSAIYERLYLQKVTGEGKHQHLRCYDIQEVGQKSGKISLRFSDRIHSQQSWQDYDAVVLATGYRYDQFNQMLDKLEPLMLSQQVERHYRLPMKSSCKVNVFLQGCCESSHGLSDTLLSVLAIRSKEIVDSLFDNIHVERENINA
ncbi:lysine N(6)-hydroxylase/L-ornithine N(5)-oxygenase family protein [Vibrio ostreicida]|uniref:Lysine N(6)-hydroxylase/L-ornithine N(5)-oxygenase family protein n=1 Tax=Vibrio ostreicida TaxID=526588 RepID=A0ABT8BSH4_9VIBR|nr:lysine N(6)-hydroxylase/L-ornithine N(5)-oxygenase family protein [Vibrio ostreicida]MDN3609931.1 lysine N(6)-hydroxylase/L-ornithine N(5)-oxygenase family protein [Vibrio ostreicida]NPD10361.1 lysine N(6)-hydroxylase/L-ornithine N(5)-oxygenase family protein [Vibrio ostreicida]